MDHIRRRNVRLVGMGIRLGIIEVDHHFITRVTVLLRQLTTIRTDRNEYAQFSLNVSIIVFRVLEIICDLVFGLLLGNLCSAGAVLFPRCFMLLQHYGYALNGDTDSECTLTSSVRVLPSRVSLSDRVRRIL